jgi:hypothetical protein
VACSRVNFTFFLPSIKLVVRTKLFNKITRNLWANVDFLQHLLSFVLQLTEMTTRLCLYGYSRCWGSRNTCVISNPYLISTGSEDSLVISHQTGCRNLKDIPVTLNTLSLHLPLSSQRFPCLHYASILPPYWTVHTWHRAQILAATHYLHTVRMLSRNYANAEQGPLSVSAVGDTGGWYSWCCRHHLLEHRKTCILPTQCGYVFGTSAPIHSSDCPIRR